MVLFISSPEPLVCIHKTWSRRSRKRFFFFFLFKTFWMIKVSTGANTVQCVSLNASAESASVTEVA